MKNAKKLAGGLVFLVSLLLAFSASLNAAALKGTPVDGICTGFELKDIPVGELACLYKSKIYTTLFSKYHP